MSDLLKKPSTSLINPERPERIANIRSFVMSDLSDSLTISNFPERPEQIPHICSFVLSEFPTLVLLEQ